MLTFLTVGCGPTERRAATDAQIAVWRAEVDRTDTVVNARQEAWHRTLSAALAADPPALGEPCFVRFEPAPSVGDPWFAAYVSTWSDAQQAPRVRWAADRARGTGDDLATPPVDPSSVRYALEDLARVRTREYWAPDLTLVTLAKEVPVQDHPGTYTPGTLAVRALLYDYAQDRVVCEAVYGVGNADTIELKPYQEDPGLIPDAATMSRIVAVDLIEKAFLEATKHLKQVAAAR